MILKVHVVPPNGKSSGICLLCQNRREISSGVYIQWTDLDSGVKDGLPPLYKVLHTSLVLQELHKLSQHCTRERERERERERDGKKFYICTVGEHSTNTNANFG